jgi:pimeloyl-ACP methyl ester carboxylesterase
MAADLLALMDALGHRRFAAAGHDTGMWIGYALAADYPDRVDRLAVAETPLPGVPVAATVRQRGAVTMTPRSRSTAMACRTVV